MFLTEDRYATAKPTPADRARLIVLSGCSGGGKSALLKEMAARGWRVAPESGRQIVREQNLVGGDAVPSKDFSRFAGLCISRSVHFYHQAIASGSTTLFDRSVVDAVTGLRRHEITIASAIWRTLEVHSYGPTVFMAPPWEDLFANDAERRHSFEDAVDEYEWLLTAYVDLGYAIEVLPRDPIPERADWLESRISTRKEVA